MTDITDMTGFNPAHRYSFDGRLEARGETLLAVFTRRTTGRRENILFNNGGWGTVAIATVLMSKSECEKLAGQCAAAYPEETYYRSLEALKAGIALFEAPSPAPTA